MGRGERKTVLGERGVYETEEKESNPARDSYQSKRQDSGTDTGGCLAWSDHGSMYQNIPRALRLQGRDDFS